MIEKIVKYLFTKRIEWFLCCHQLDCGGGRNALYASHLIVVEVGMHYMPHT